LDCGFESQEAFTRAFRRTFGMPPGQFKRHSFETRLEKERIMSAITQVKLDLVQSPELVKREKFVVAGPTSRFGVDNRDSIPERPDIIFMFDGRYELTLAAEGVVSLRVAGHLGIARGMVGGMVASTMYVQRQPSSPPAYAAIAPAMNGPNSNPTGCESQ
jgi:hypothetical protein